MLEVRAQFLVTTALRYFDGAVEEFHRNVTLANSLIVDFLLFRIYFTVCRSTVCFRTDAACLLQIDEGVITSLIQSSGDGNSGNRIHQFIIQPLERARPVFGTVFHRGVETFVPVANHQLACNAQSVPEPRKTVQLDVGFGQPHGELNVFGALAQHGRGEVLYQLPVGDLAIPLDPFPGLQLVIGPASLPDPVPLRGPAHVRTRRLLRRDRTEEVVRIQCCCSRHGRARSLLQIELGDGALCHRPLCRHVAFGGAFLILLGVGPFDGAISHPDGFRRELFRTGWITVLNHTAN